MHTRLSHVYIIKLLFSYNVFNNLICAFFWGGGGGPELPPWICKVMNIKIITKNVPPPTSFSTKLFIHEIAILVHNTHTCKIYYIHYDMIYHIHYICIKSIKGACA